MRSSRPLALACLAALFHLLTAGIATAQTVSVTRAPKGSSVEIIYNAAKAGSAIADASGVATIDINKLSEPSQQVSVRFAVDLCKDIVRVHMIDAGTMEPPEAGCTRKDVNGLFVMRRVTNFVIDVSQPTPTVWVAQGPAPKPWLDPNAAVGADVPGIGAVQKGLVLGGGAGLARFANAETNACGNVSNCKRTTGQWALNAAATMWITRWLGAEVGLVNPLDRTFSGSGTNFSFNTTLETRMLTLAGKVGAPAGPARLYGFGGMNYHWIVSNTTETIADSTVTVGNSTVPIPGGRHTSGLLANGWGWLFGGGAEIWAKPRFAIFGEVGWIPLKENNQLGGEAKIDDRVTYLIGGVRIRVLP